MMPLWLALRLLALLWDFDRDVEPTPFLVIIESAEHVTGTQRLLVAGVVDGHCAAFPSADSETWCTTIVCPGPGTFRITVEALRYQTRSNTIQIRVRDAACTIVEGAPVAPGPYASVPQANHCRPSITVQAPPVTVETPSTTTVTVPIPQPHTTAPVIPVNPQVVAKKPHAPGTTMRPTPRSETAPPTPRQATDTQPLIVTLHTGPPTTVTVTPPPVTLPGVACPP